MYAVTANKIEIVKILLEHNVDTLITDRNYLTAKDIADIKGFTEVNNKCALVLQFCIANNYFFLDISSTRGQERRRSINVL